MCIHVLAVMLPRRSVGLAEGEEMQVANVVHEPRQLNEQIRHT